MHSRGREEPIVLSWRDHSDQPMRAKSIVFHEIAADGLATGMITPRRFLRLYPGYRSDVLIQARLKKERTTYRPPWRCIRITV